jgi:hypothetical protein
MKKLKSGKSIMKIVFVMVFVLAVGLQESKGDIITSGTVGSRIAIGVNSDGTLNTPNGSGYDADGQGPGTARGGTDIGVLNDGTFAAGSTGIALEWNDTLFDYHGEAGGPDFGNGFYDGTSPGCLCEGWGVSGYNGGLFGSDPLAGSGYSNKHHAQVNLTVDNFWSDSTSITSETSLTAGPSLSVKQVFTAAPQASDRIFQNLVTITNTGGTAIDNVRYTRVMDWDIPMREFIELVTLQGTGTTAFLEEAHDGGFSGVNPFATHGIFPPGTPNALKGDFEFELLSSVFHSSTSHAAATGATDFVKLGGLTNSDHGAYFRFNFGTLGAGESKSFFVFYGAAQTELEMLEALQLVGTELYSLGQGTNLTSGGVLIDPSLMPTYAFAFKDVGGVPIVDVIPVIPEPGTFALLGIGLAGLGYFGRKRILKKK